MLQNIYNLSSATNGALVLSKTTQQEEYPCSNVLGEEEDEIWITEVGLPQEIIIEVAPHSRPVSCIGWFCKKRYVFNPKKIKMYISREREGPFIHWSSLKADENSSIHLFTIKPIPPDFRFFRFSITETFGGNRVYLNKIYILHEQPQHSSNSSKNDTASEVDSPEKPLSPAMNSPTYSEPPSFTFQEEPTRKEFSHKFDSLMFNSSFVNGDTSELVDFNQNFSINGTVMLNCSNNSLKDISSSPLISIPLPKPSKNSRPLSASLPYYKKPTTDPSKELAPNTSQEPKKSSPPKEVKQPERAPLTQPPKEALKEESVKYLAKTLSSKIRRESASGKENNRNIILEEKRVAKSKTRDSVAKTKKGLEELSEKVNEINKTNKVRGSVAIAKDVQDCNKKVEQVQNELAELQKRISDLENNVQGIVKKEVDEFKVKFYEKVGVKFKNSLTKMEQRVARDIYRVMDERIRTLTHQSECKMFDNMRSQINHMKQEMKRPTNEQVAKQSSLSTQPSGDMDSSTISTSEQVALLKQRMQHLN